MNTASDHEAAEAPNGGRFARRYQPSSQIAATAASQPASQTARERRPTSKPRRLLTWFLEPPDKDPSAIAAMMDRFPVGAIFIIEGILKFRSPDEFGVGRFARIGIVAPGFFAPFDGVFEIGCGTLLLIGLLTRLAVVPMIINMLVAIYTTKLPVLLKDGFWRMAHAALLDYAVLLGLISLLIVGAGPWSLDERYDYKWKDVFS